MTSKSNFDESWLSSWTLVEFLGSGSYGAVYKVQNKTTSEDSAVKVTYLKKHLLDDLSDSEKEATLAKTRREFLLLQDKHHDNIVNVHEHLEESLNINDIQNMLKTVIVSTDKSAKLFKHNLEFWAAEENEVDMLFTRMELCEMNLRQWIDSCKEDGSALWTAQTTIINDILQGLTFLHQNQILHRDLKSENVFLGTIFPKISAKIGDFGISRVIHSEYSRTSELTGKPSTTPLYKAPELDGNEYTLQADLYSLGLLIFEIIKMLKSGDRKVEFVRIKNKKTKVGLPKQPFVNAGDVVLQLIERDIKNRLKTVEDVKLEPAVSVSDADKPKKNRSSTVKSLARTGSKRGLQGRANSCYMDSFMFALFYGTEMFNKSLLEERAKDSEDAKKLRKILREKIQQPIQRDFYIPYENTKELRQFLGKFDEKFTGAMMDVEEMVYGIFQDVLNVKEYLHYETEIEEFVHFISIDGDSTEIQDKKQEFLNLQFCLEHSFKLTDNLRLKKVPFPAFFIGLPRNDGDLLHFQGIITNLQLNLQNVFINETCGNCTSSAEWECLTSENNLVGRRCSKCISDLSNNDNVVHIVSTLWMDLYAVICINGSHYTTYAKDEFDADGEWLYFDSMAGEYPHVEEAKRLERDLKQIGEEMQPNLKSRWVKDIVKDGRFCIYKPRKFIRD